MPQQVRLADVQDSPVRALHQVHAGGQRQLAQHRAQVRLALPVEGHGWLGEGLGTGLEIGCASWVWMYACNGA